ncbi:hypothetical protein C5F59_020335 [Streptomyces sp. QL37]|uniref:hypothetical protein n=1 Tax=Streptomyces sp. QL37 TaxID=2093747 RepID=UPI000CF285A9|nr:hypothetical protein [Streptomyces sp. QL37]PPQ58386.1 hypothetical protein C5F59_18180 [Streptomyces sp. QL37]
MNDPGGETAEQQAYITRFLLDYTAVPLAGGTFLRGVLPARDAVRVVTGAADAVAPHELVAFEVPLSDEDEEPVTAPLVLAWTRTLASGSFPHTDATVMGMPLIPVDTTVLEPADSSHTDQALRVLRTLAWPFVEAPPSPALCGFLFTGQDSMRLYLAVDKAHGLIAADVQLTGALTALLAALPSLIGEEERWVTDTSDPHCVHAVDLTTW